MSNDTTTESARGPRPTKPITAAPQWMSDSANSNPDPWPVVRGDYIYDKDGVDCGNFPIEWPDGSEYEITTGVKLALGFLDRWPGKSHTLAALDKKTGTLSARTFAWSTERDACAEWLRSQIPFGSIYFHPNEARKPRHAKLARNDIGTVRAVWVDIDPRRPPAALLQLPLEDSWPDLVDWQKAERDRLHAIVQAELDSDTPPSSAIDSGGGIQLFYLLSSTYPTIPANVEMAERIGKALKTKFNGDDVHDLARMMRLPGTLNWPNDAKRKAGRGARPATVLGTSTRTYTLAALNRFAGEHPPTTATTVVAKGLTATPVSAHPRAVHYLTHEAPVAVEGAGGHNATFAVALRCKDLGLDADETIAAMLEHWNERCEPPWEVAELSTIVRNAFKYGKQPRGVSAPEAEFEAVAKPATRGLQLVCAADVKAEPIDWLWPGWLARGKLHIIAGRAGTGKTTIALSWAATISAGGFFPNRHRARGGSVLVWSGEDSANDTLVPRLMAAGADCLRVHLVGPVKEKDVHRSFDPAQDVPLLAAAIAGLDTPPVLLIVDPIVMGVTGDSHKNAEVRRGLFPLVTLAERFGIALIGVTHFSKGTAGRDPLERVTGSLAFGAMARLVFGTAKDDAGDGYLLARVKSNIGPDGGGFAYELAPAEPQPGISTSRVVWGEPLDGNARALLAQTDGGQATAAPRGDAIEWLRDLLAAGPMPVGTIKEEAAAAGFAWRTIQRAKTEAGIRAEKSGFADGVWMWRLPELVPISK